MAGSELIMDQKDIEDAICTFADEIFNQAEKPEELILLGIRTRGVILAKRIQQLIKEKRDVEIPMGILDITLYRDDLSTLGKQPVVGTTEIPVSIDDRRVILIDDVLYTGRTIRSALDAIVDLGRPKSIQLVILIDRGLREYPIHPDLVARQIKTSRRQVVQVRLNEIDGEEKVLILKRA